MSGGFIRVLCDRVLVVYHDSTPAYHFYLFGVPSLDLLCEITPPQPFKVPLDYDTIIV